MSEVVYRPFIFDQEKREAYRLWMEELGKQWPISDEKFYSLIREEDDDGSFVAEKDGRMIGLIITKVGVKGEVMVVIVEKQEQRRGIGTELMQIAMEYFEKRNVEAVQLGAGGGSYFWPGVPDNLPEATSFFTKLGWIFDAESVDMIGDLSAFDRPEDVYQKIENSGVKFITAEMVEEKLIIEFEKQNFPQWTKYFESALSGENGEDVLLAIGNNSEIVGSVLVGTKGNIWDKILGDKVGSIGALGVKEESRGQGIGLALAAKATEMLKDKGFDRSFLRWTYLEDWYSKLGYKVWQRYNMSYKI